MSERSLLVLDIDSTVRYGFTELGRFVNDPADVVVFPEATDRMREWKTAGGHIIGVSNQAGIALGYMTDDSCRAAMERTNELTGDLFDEIRWCPHATFDQCGCRKPHIGMSFYPQSYGACRIVCHTTYGWRMYDYVLMIGDRDEDQEFARRANIGFQWADAWRKGEQA